MSAVGASAPLPTHTAVPVARAEPAPVPKPEPLPKPDPTPAIDPTPKVARVGVSEEAMRVYAKLAIDGFEAVQRGEQQQGVLHIPSEDADEHMEQAINQALADVAWLMDMLGGGGDYTDRARDAARQAVEQQIEAASRREAQLVALRQNEALALSVEGLSIGFAEGTDKVTVSIGSVSLTVTSETQLLGVQGQEPLLVDLTGNGIPQPRGRGDDGPRLPGEKLPQENLPPGLARLYGEGEAPNADPLYRAMVVLREGDLFAKMAEAGRRQVRLDLLQPMGIPLQAGLVVSSGLFAPKAPGDNKAVEGLFDVKA